MLISRYDLGRGAKFRFAWWRMMAWVLLLLAAFGCLQYIRHAQQVWAMLQSLAAGDPDADPLHGMLAWDLAYFVVAFAVIVASAGCILRQAWARPVLRALSLILSVWAAYRAFYAFSQWRTLGDAGSAMASAGGFTAGQVAQWEYFRHLALIGVGLGVVAALLLLWLAWQLGQPAVRLQFRARPF